MCILRSSVFNVVHGEMGTCAKLNEFYLSVWLHYVCAGHKEEKNINRYQHFSNIMRHSTPNSVHKNGFGVEKITDNKL